MTVEEYEYTKEEKYAIPFVSESPQTNICEIYEVSEMVLETLDELEGHPEWYTRKEVQFEIIEMEPKQEPACKEVMKAWIYFNDNTQGKINVICGDFSVAYPLTE